MALLPLPALPRPYPALQAKNYEQAVALFLQATAAAPKNTALRKDLAYTYLKTGEREVARDSSARPCGSIPPIPVALEYAFLCFETRKEAEARRIFDRLRRSADPSTSATAAKPSRISTGRWLPASRRWTEALRRGDNSFSTHYELATTGRAARRTRPGRRTL